MEVLYGLSYLSMGYLHPISPILQLCGKPVPTYPHMYRSKYFKLLKV